MNKDNKNTELNDTDKKLHISDVMCCDCGKLIGESQSKYRCQDCYEDYMEK